MVGFSFAAALSLLAGSTYARDSSTDERLVERSKPFKYTPVCLPLLPPTVLRLTTLSFPLKTLSDTPLTNGPHSCPTRHIQK